MLNRIIIMGRLVRDPELRTTQSGKSVTSFTLAVDRDFKGQNGEKETDFIDVVAWGVVAEFVCKYFAKGRMAIAEGRLQIREWKDKDGNNRRTAEIIAEHVYFGDSKPSEGSNAPNNSAPTYGGGYGAPAGGGFSEIPDDSEGDLPF